MSRESSATSKITIEIQTISHEYNKYMKGVDLLDQMPPIIVQKLL